MGQPATRSGALRPAERRIPLRFVTATALFDGHDAAINLVRRLLVEAGAEVVHLGHNRSVEEIARAAVEEDADAVAVSSYQGGHLPFFRYLAERLRALGAPGIRIFAGGGGTISAAEAETLRAAGVTRVYTAEVGLRLGLDGMVQDMLAAAAPGPPARPSARGPGDAPCDRYALARALSRIERGTGARPAVLADSAAQTGGRRCPVVGITGTGGAGKSSLLDELLGLWFTACPQLRIACLTIDPTRSRSGGALLGDRIRINNALQPNLFLRSLATRRRHATTGRTLGRLIACLREHGFDLVVVETAGSGQADSAIADLADLAVYVMTADFGAPSQLEKIEMLSYADLVAVNKADHAGTEDAVAEVRRHWLLEHPAHAAADDAPPVFATQASRHGDPGTRALFAALLQRLLAQLPGPGPVADGPRDPAAGDAQDTPAPLIPPLRRDYLARIAQQARDEAARLDEEAAAASSAWQHHTCLRGLGDPQLPAPLQAYPQAALDATGDATLQALRRGYQQALARLGDESLDLLRGWPALAQRYAQDRVHYRVRAREIAVDNRPRTPSGTVLPRVALPDAADWGERLRFLRTRQLPGHYPYTAGVFPFRRTHEDAARMFAGEGLAERTNRRFHLLARGQKSVRLSTAFDPVVLYGEDPSARPDVYGRIGMSGVSVATLDDFKRLYSGFDLCDPQTSVSMTINGPGPVVLAGFIDTAIDQQVELWLRRSGGWSSARRRIAALLRDRARPVYRGERPAGHDGLGLGLLGVSGAELVDAAVYRRIRADSLARLRGTLQADILKEDQAQNECLFPVDFALRLMGDVQAFIGANRMRNFYGVSVSGYHIAEAGANPVTQLAFTLANGFTLLEYFLARGLAVDEVAPHLSFFFSNGMDAEYAVIGRVARRVWARALRRCYRAGGRGQRLKYHIQTSGRSLHERDWSLNDIRTTLEALYAIHDNCNSLHTNAADEAMTTPTEASVRRALAIQMIINREYGIAACENLLQGAYAIEALTDRVEAAVYREFERLSARGGVLGAMETGYQRRRIQEESLAYERARDDGSLAIVGVNCFLPDDGAAAVDEPTELIRSSEAEKTCQIERVAEFRHAHRAVATDALGRLQRAARRGDNLFDELLDTVRVATLGQIVQALYGVCGRYRRAL